MTIWKYYKVDPVTYRKIHNNLRRQLSKIAFDNYFQCNRCGSHHNLEVHIPVCDPMLMDQPGFYEILCEDCHKLVKAKKKAS